MGLCSRVWCCKPVNRIFGNKGFDRVENVLAIIKVAAILMFLVIAAALLAGWIGGGKYAPKLPLSYSALFPAGGLGLWSAFIFAFMPMAA